MLTSSAEYRRVVGAAEDPPPAEEKHDDPPPAEAANREPLPLMFGPAEDGALPADGRRLCWAGLEIGWVGADMGGADEEDAAKRAGIPE